MKKIKNLTLSLLLALTGGAGFAQNGLEGIIVERYYVSNASDASGSIGALPAGSVTYRVFADLLPGYNFQAIYGVSGHTLLINTSTSFFNNEDRGNTTPSIGSSFINDNTVALDSWFSVGGAANGNMGILKSEDDGAANLITGNSILQNANPEAGIPLMTQDGIVAGTPVAVTFVGLTTELDVFNATSNAGNSFSTSNGSVAALGGAVGPIPSSNKVLIGQFTTDGTFHFELNIQIGTPLGGTENYVASNPVGAEISIPSLTFTSTPVAPLATSTVTYCEGSTATALTATGCPDCTLNWYIVPVSGSASTTAPVPSTTTAGTTSYYVSQTNGVNESIRTQIDVIVNPTPSVPTISAGGPTTFCDGGSVVLTSSAVSGNMWTTSETTDAITVTASGSYAVTETNGSGCSASSTPVSVTVNPLPATPIISAGGSTSICAGNSVTLTSSASSGNTWSTTETSNSISVSSAGTYSVTVSDINGCEAVSLPTTVTVNPVPTAIGGVSSVTGNDVTFMNTSTGASTYFWDFGDASTSTATSPVHTYATNGNYVVTLVAISGGCSDTTTFSTNISVGISEAQASDATGISIYPNPVNQEATIGISLSNTSNVTVNIYDVTGKVAVNVYSGSMSSGMNTLKVNASGLPAGIYFTTIVSDTMKKTLKMVIVK